MITTLDQLFAARLGDYRLFTMAWVNNGENLTLVLSKTSIEWSLNLTFVWATKLRLDLDFGEMFGEPLLFEASFTPIEAGRWSVRLDFAGAPSGMISLDCNEILVKSIVKEE
jgi:hypothetical protein